MREIKFRIRLQSYTDKNKKPFFVYMPLEQLIDRSLGTSPVGEFVEDRWGNDINNYQIMTTDEYTGLKDKNNKEIYEGDIVTGYTSFEQSNDEMEWTKSSPAIVKWNDTICGFYPFFNNARWRCNVEDIEVIGNIHENPELLK